MKIFLDAKCVSLPDDKAEGLSVLRANTDTVLVPFKENVTLRCNSVGRKLRGTVTSGFRQCVYDPKPVSSTSTESFFELQISCSDILIDFRVCLTIGCLVLNQLVNELIVVRQFQLLEPSMATYVIQNFIRHSSLDAKTRLDWLAKLKEMITLFDASPMESGTLVTYVAKDQFVRILGDQLMVSNLQTVMSRCSFCLVKFNQRKILVPYFFSCVSFMQGSEVQFGCSKPGYILINPRPITCIREPECKVIKPLGITSGRIPDSAINATSER